MPLENERWREEETRLLINLWGEADVQARLDGTVRSNTVYKKIQSFLLDKKCFKTVTQIRNKLKWLKKMYKEIKDSCSVSGSGTEKKRKFVYFDQMDTILGCRDSTAPAVLLQSILENGLESESAETDLLETSEMLEMSFFDYSGECSEVMDLSSVGRTVPEDENATFPEAAAAATCEVETQPSTSKGNGTKKQMKRKRTSLKEFNKATMETTMESFKEFEREIEQEIKKYRDEKLCLERKKIELLEKILDKSG